MLMFFLHWTSGGDKMNLNINLQKTFRSNKFMDSVTPQFTSIKQSDDEWTKRHEALWTLIILSMNLSQKTLKKYTFKTW